MREHKFLNRRASAMHFNPRKIAFGLFLATSMMAGATQALAQLANQTTTASPDRASDQLGGAVFEPRVMPRVEVKEAAIQQAPAGAEKVSFTLQRLDIQGVSVYPEGELQNIVDSKIGQTITLADLYALAAELTAKYRNDGYILTQVVVPPQTIESGTAKLQVVEGFINNVEVRGEGEHIDDAVLLARGYSALVRADSNALNVRQLERTLLLINDIPGISARGILSPSETTPGAADLLVLVERDRFEGMISLDNHGSRYLGPVQFGVSGAANSLLGLNERITGQLAYAPNEDMNDELAYAALGYTMPVGVYGTSIELFASATETEPGYNLKQFDVDGSSRFFSATVSHPFVRTRNLNLTGRAGIDLRNVRTENNIEDPRKDHIRAVRVGGRLEFVDTVLGVAYNTFDLELGAGLDILGSTDGNDTNTSRPGAESDFVKLEAEYQRLQRLTRKLNVLLGIKGQHADEALWSSEEFGVGGLAYGRGFDPSEIVGDSGVAGKIELQWNEPTELSLLTNYQLFGFYDAGVVWDKDATTSKLKREELTSAGFGIRADFTETTQAGLFLAFPLNRDIETQNDKDPRVYVSVSHKF